MDNQHDKAPTEELPFGAGAIDSPGDEGTTKKRRPRRRKPAAEDADAKADVKSDAKSGAPPARKPRRKPASEKAADAGSDSGSDSGGAKATRPSRSSKADAAPKGESEAAASNDAAPQSGGAPQGDRIEGESSGSRRRRRWKERRRRKRGGGGGGGSTDGGATTGEAQQPKTERAARPAGEGRGGSKADSSGGGSKNNGKAPLEETEGLLIIEHASHGHLHMKANGFRSTKLDAHVPPRLVQKYGLRTGSMIKGPMRRGQGRHKWELVDVLEVDGKDPKDVRKVQPFKSLTSIDPDFHYEVGDSSGEVSMKVVDILCPIGRGQRGLIVAPPRSGKTVLLQQFARAIEKTYPEVHLMVLLVDERPEEATEWQRSTKGDVFVSTNDEMHKTHVELCETVWARATRLVELGEDVILLLDSITRMGRAYNNVKGNSGKTMSGGIDARALERPKQFFGAARNTETAGSLTILATCLIETGSRMDQVIFEEFKGTGNMELVLSRKLADRRIFPAIDVVKTGTRKEEKLFSRRRLAWVNTLRRVLLRMHFAEAMELLVTKLDDVEKIDDFLQRFEVDPDA